MFENLRFAEHGPNCKHTLTPSVKHTLPSVRNNRRMTTLGERINKRRQELDVPVSRIAAACEITPQSVYQWESGDTKGLKPENLVIVAELLHTTERWLVTGRGQKDRRIARDELDDKEAKLIDHFRELVEGHQDAVLALAVSLNASAQASRKGGGKG
jgi:transcriptional regulator with XRE-family HTH domain